MTDEELLQRTAMARQAAHEAPLARVFEENKGGKPTGVLHIDSHTRGYADRSSEFFALWEECQRRGLSMPCCACPPGAH